MLLLLWQSRTRGHEPTPQLKSTVMCSGKNLLMLRVLLCIERTLGIHLLTVGLGHMIVVAEKT